MITMQQELAELNSELSSPAPIDKNTQLDLLELKHGRDTDLQAQRNMENHIELCMNERGFYYAAQVEPLAHTEEQPIQILSEQAFRQNYGYGLYPKSGETTTGHLLSEQNRDYLANLDNERQQQFQQALYGVNDLQEGSSIGCLHEAEDLTAQVYDANSITHMEQPDEFASAEIEELAALNSQWADCVASKGLYDNPSDIILDIQNEYILAQMALEGSELAENLQQLQAKEIKLAELDWHCQQRLQYQERLEMISAQFN